MIIKLKSICTLFILYFLIFIGCENGGSDLYTGDQYINELKKNLDEMSMDLKIHPSSKHAYNVNYLLPIENCEQLIIVDGANENLLLVGDKGEVLSRAGGVGRGPGEYQSILSPHIGYDKRLYIIDGILKRVTVYEIVNEKLNYVSSIKYEEPPKYFLNSVYVTKFGKFGVYQYSEGFFSPENNFLLYRLDEDFYPVEQLLEMPGHERYESLGPGFTLYIPHKYLGKTIWGVDDSWFYYITTMSSPMYKYNLQSEVKQETTFIHMDERLNSPDLSKLVKDYYSVEDNEEYWNVVDDIKSLPLLSQIISGDGRVILKVMATPGEEGLVLHFDKDSKNLQYFRTPQEFSPTAICDNIIYGIDFNIEGNYEIMKIELTKK